MCEFVYLDGKLRCCQLHVFATSLFPAWRCDERALAMARSGGRLSANLTRGPRVCFEPDSSVRRRASQGDNFQGGFTPPETTVA
jgi:hypothetical protein